MGSRTDKDAIGRALRAILASLSALALLLSASIPPASAAPGNEPGRQRSRVGVVEGSPPPMLSAVDVQSSQAVSWDGLRGRVVILDFWATWCGACHQAMPALEAMHRRHGARGLSVVGVSSESLGVIRHHLPQMHVSYTIAHDNGGTMRRFGVRALPTLVVVDRRGTVRQVMVGVDGSSMRALDRLVEQLLSESAS